MDSPRDRDGFDDRRPGDWQEPEHLGKGPAGPTPDTPLPDTPPPVAPTPADAGDQPGGSTAWQPPGWDLPTVEPGQPSSGSPAVPPVPPAAPAPPGWSAPPAGRPQDDAVPPGAPETSGSGGLFGGRRRREPGAAEQVFRREQDPVGVQAWAMHHGWVPSDGTGAHDAPLAELVRSAPVRPSREDSPGNVVRGRGLGLDLVAFDIVYASGRYVVPRWAVTAAPVLGEVPGFRLSPARLWKHRTGGLVQIPSGDPEFDARWVLLTTGDGPRVRHLAADAGVRQLLLGTDDGDELWSAAGFVAAIRPDGHRPQLIEHHARLLATVVGALAATA